MITISDKRTILTLSEDFENISLVDCFANIDKLNNLMDVNGKILLSQEYVGTFHYNSTMTSINVNTSKIDAAPSVPTAITMFIENINAVLRESVLPNNQEVQ